MVQRKESNFEKHLQSAISVVLVGLVGWAGINLQSQSTTMATLNERVSNLQEQVVDMRNEIRIRATESYSRKDAEKDHKVIDGRIDNLDKRISRLEEKYR